MPSPTLPPFSRSLNSPSTAAAAAVAAASSPPSAGAPGALSSLHASASPSISSASSRSVSPTSPLTLLSPFTVPSNYIRSFSSVLVRPRPTRETFEAEAEEENEGWRFLYAPPESYEHYQDFQDPYYLTPSTLSSLATFSSHAVTAAPTTDSSSSTLRSSPFFSPSSSFFSSSLSSSSSRRYERERRARANRRLRITSSSPSTSSFSFSPIYRDLFLPSSPASPLPSLQPFLTHAKSLLLALLRAPSHLLSKLFAGYSNLLETHFFLTSLVQATVLGICGDIAAQNVEVLVRGGLLRAGGLEGGIVAGVQRLLQGFKPDWVRTRNVAVLTTAIDGLLTPQYYVWMERWFSEKKSVKVIMQKLLVGICIFGPLANGTFLAGVPVLSAGALSGFNLAVWKKQLAYATTRDVQMWSFFYPLNFLFVPRKFRPLATNLMGLFFLVVLSLCAYSG
ncbi:mpv17-like protein [Nannochloropsis oceanica]